MLDARWAKPRHTLTRRVANVLAGPLALVTFCVSLAFAALLHLNLSSTRVLARDLTVVFFNGYFAGHIRVDAITRLDITGLGARGITISDPQGRPVLSASELQVHASLVRILGSVIAGAGAVDIEVSEIVLRRPALHLLESDKLGPEGQPVSHPSIADAFAPRNPEPPKESEPTPLRISFPRVRLERLYARGRLDQSHEVTAEVPLAKASVLITGNGVTIDVDRFGLRALGIAGVETLAVGEVSVAVPGVVKGSIRGKVGSVSITQDFRFEGDRLLVQGEVSNVRPAALRKFIPNWPLEATLSVKNKIEGTLPRLRANVSVSAGSGSIQANGLLTTAPEIEADLDLDMQNVDLSEFDPALPKSRLNVRSAVDVWLSDGRPNFEFNATLAESQYEAVALPVIDMKGSYDERGLVADATLHERGLPLHLAVTGDPQKQLDFEVSLKHTGLDESPRLRELLGAKGTVTALARGTFDGSKLRSTFDVSGTDVSAQNLSLRKLTAQGSLEMDVRDPDKAQFGLDVRAEEVRAGEIVLSKAQLRSRGSILAPELLLDATTADGAPVHVEARAHPDWPGLSRVKGHVGRDAEAVTLSLERLSVSGDTVEVQGLRVQSGGQLAGNVSYSPRRIRADLEAQGLDLERLSRSVGLDRTRLSGKLDLHLDAELGVSSSGHATLALRDGGAAGLAGLGVDLQTEFDGRRTTGQLSTTLEGVGAGHGTWDISAAGPLAYPTSYERATGRVGMRLERIELAWLARLLPKKANVDRASGTLALEVELSRDDGSAFPDVTCNLSTQGLSIDVGESDDIKRIDAVDLALAGSIDEGKKRLEAAAQLSDAQGEMLTVTGGIDLPLASWVRRLPSDTDLEEVLQDAPLEAVVQVPERRVADFPPVLSLPRWQGRVSLRGTVRGTARDPDFDVGASARDLAGKEIGLEKPIDLDVSVRYRLKTGKLASSLQAKQGSSRIVSGAMKIVLPIEHVMKTPPEGTPAWTGAAQVVLEGTPLKLVSALTEEKIAGSAQGSLSVTRDGYPLELTAKIRLRELTLDRKPLGEGEMSLGTHENRLTLRAHFDDEYGSIDLSGSVGTKPTPWALRYDDSAPLALKLRSEGYDAKALTPFTAGTLSELGGALVGRIDLEFNPGSEPGARAHTALSGQLRMEDGVITPKAMGLRFTGTHFTLTAQREGDLNVLVLDGFRAKGRATSENIRGKAKLYLRDLGFERATFELEPDHLPLLNAGTKVADVTGRVVGQVKRHEQHSEVAIDLSGLVVELPTGTDAGVIALEDNPSIEVVQRPPRKETVVQERGDPLRLLVSMGRGVKVTSPLFEVVVQGEPEIDVRDEVAIAGQVSLIPGGHVQVLGKVFLIEKGLIAFDGTETTNPHLDVAATWRSASGILVRAHISGTAKDPTLEWSSEPPLPGGESAVVAMVIGGGGGTGGQGGAMASYAAAAAVNQMIGEVGVRNVEVYAGRESQVGGGQVARLSDRTWDSYTASIQLSDELWFQGSYKQESSGPGTTPRAGLSGTLDWRFDPNWSISTELGWLGTGVDLLWQYRY